MTNEQILWDSEQMWHNYFLASIVITEKNTHPSHIFNGSFTKPQLDINEQLDPTDDHGCNYLSMP